MISSYAAAPCPRKAGLPPQADLVIGAVAKTSALALTNATQSYALEIATKGWKKACLENQEIRLGANMVSGHVTYERVADAFGLPYKEIYSLLS